LFERLDVPILRRIHPDPPSHDMKALRQFARVAGYNIPQHPSRTELQNLLDAVRGKPAQHAVHLAVLQTLSRAEYAPLHIGHFALASEHYTHFTSPIRRYPDLLVHRALEAYLEHSAQQRKGGGRHKSKLGKALRDDERVPDEPALVDLGRNCSQKERNAEAAEHDLTNYLVLKLLSNKLGDDFDGTVTGVTSTGLFIQLDRLLVDGFVHINDLPAGQSGTWRFNQNTGSLVASRSAQSIAIGDRFTVRISNVNPQARRLDLVIIEEKTSTKSKKRRQPAGARKAHEQTMKLKRTKKAGRNKTKP
jgi:ribonuclease R